MQTEEEMRTQLLDQGLADAVFDPNDGRLVEGERMTRLVRTLATLEEAIIALERRGISLKIHAERQDPAGRLPIYHVFLAAAKNGSPPASELDDFVAAARKRSRRQTNVATPARPTRRIRTPRRARPATASRRSTAA